MKPTKGQRIFAVFNYILLTLLALLCLLPMLNIVALSFSSRNMVNAGAVTFLPKEFTISSYLYMLQKSGLIPALLVTVKRLVLGVVLNLIMTISVAYPLSKSEKLFKSRKFYVAFFLITMIFNGGIIPTYLVIKQFHMLDTIWALILPNSVTMFYVLLMLNFFRGIPDEIEEAAVVDGAGWLTILLKIYLPLSLPSLATVTLFIIVGHWNEWFDGMIYNNHTDNYPLMTFLQYHVLNFKTSDLRPEQIAANPALADLEGRSIKSAGIVLCTLPDLLYLPVAEYSQLAEAGKLAPLDDVLEQYGSELTKKNLNSDGGKILEAAKRNDVLYGIPSGNAERIPSQFLWIRKDWLDKLGLDVPKTLDDVVEVARAFKNDDPDGNGVDDTWGLGVCNEMSDYAGYGTIEGVVNAFGGSILQYMWMPNDDGTVSYEPTSQETRNALEKLAAMYSEGLINEEFGVSDTDAISEAVAAGTCGLFYGTDGISWGAGRDAIANNNDCGWMVINAPSVEGGDATAYSYTNFDYVYAVNANCEHPEALIKLINFNNDRINSPDATLDSLEVWGVNSKTGINQCDYTYALLDPYLNKAIGYNTTIGQVFAGELKPEELMPEAYRYYVGIKRYVDEGYDKTGSANPDDLTAFQYAMCWGPKFGSWTRYSELRDAGMKMSVYTGAPTKTMMKRWSTLLALQDETFVKIISGSLGIEAFDDFVTQWNEQGGSTIQEEIAEMYMK